MGCAQHWQAGTHNVYLCSSLFYAEIRRGFRALIIHQEERAPEKMEQNPAAQRSVGDSDPGTVRRTERWRAAALVQYEL